MPLHHPIEDSGLLVVFGRAAEASSLLEFISLFELFFEVAVALSVQRERSMTREVSTGRELRATSMNRDYRASVSRESRPGGVRDIRSMSRDIRASVAREFEAVTRDFLSTREETKEPVPAPVTPLSVNKDK